jgi:uncharacterized protein YdeI (YjbR/CyaY-like superfamily)
MMMRDRNTKALLADDAAALNKYKMDRQQSREVKRLAQELEEVKIMLRNVCEKIERIEKV